MTNAGISYIDYYIPQNTISVNELVENVPSQAIPGDFNSRDDYIKFCKDSLKLERVRLENKLEDYQMLEVLLNKMYEDNIVRPEEINVIILAQERYNYSMENIPQYVQYKYKMKKASVFNLSGNHCVNIEIALKIGLGMINIDNTIQNILIISTQKILNLHERIIGKVALLSDGACVALLSKKSKRFHIIDVSLLTNGYFYDLKLEENNFLLHYKYAIKLISEIIYKNDIKPEQIEKVVIQNTNPSFALKYFEKFNIYEDRIFTENIGKYGHLTSMDLLINMKDLSVSNSLKKGDLILAFGVGWAGSYQAALLLF